MIKFVNPLYFSDSIAKKNYSRIEKQLRTGSNKKKDFHIIILKENGSNLFEFIKTAEFEQLFESETSVYVIGAVKTYEDFSTYLQQKVELLLSKGLDINKDQIVKLLQGDIQ